ncbi:MAG: hypothetical protein AAGD25_28435 [Cyanobacteria bacterium P01_F01_bin.150]
MVIAIFVAKMQTNLMPILAKGSPPQPPHPMRWRSLPERKSPHQINLPSKIQNRQSKIDRSPTQLPHHKRSPLYLGF